MANLNTPIAQSPQSPLKHSKTEEGVSAEHYEEMVHNALCQVDKVCLEDLGKGMPELKTMLGHCRTMEYS